MTATRMGVPTGRLCVLIFVLVLLSCLVSGREGKKPPPHESVELYNLALATQRHDIKKAIQLYNDAIAIHFEFPEAHQNVAILYESLQQYAEARQHNLYSVDVSDNDMFVSFALLNLLQTEMRMVNQFPHTVDQFQLWMSYCEKSIELSNSTNAEAYFNLALLERQVGLADDALAHFLFILHNIDARDFKALLNVGNHYFFNDKHENATTYYLRALERSIEDYEKAKEIRISRCLKKELCNPTPTQELDNSISILNNLAQNYREQGRYYESLFYFQQAFELLDDSHEEALQFGNSAEGQRHNAMWSQWSHSQSPHDIFSPTKSWLLLSMYTIRGMLNYWKDFEELESLLIRHFEYHEFRQWHLSVESLSKLPARTESSRYQPLLRIARDESGLDPYSSSLISFATVSQDLWISAQNCFSSSFQQLTDFPRHYHLQSLLANDDIEELVFKIGYLSYDWRDHPMGRLTAAIVTSPLSEVIFQMDLPNNRKKQVRIRREVHCFSYGNDDSGPVRRFIARHCQFFHNAVQAKNDHYLASYISEQQIHVLIDITGHTNNGRLGVAIMRPSTVSINYLGYPGLAACDGVVIRVNDSSPWQEADNESGFDFTTVDRFTIPAEGVASIQRNSHFLQRERLIVLPFGYQANHLPMSLNILDEKNRLRERQSMLQTLNVTGAETLRLENRVHVCVFNANKKFEPYSFHSLVNILQQAPHSRLVLLDFHTDSQNEIKLQLSAMGVPLSRVLFLPRIPWYRHLFRAHVLCDMAVDTFVYGAHTTATDLLFAGVPIFALRGYGDPIGKMPSRVAASIIENMDSLPASPVMFDKGYRFADILVHDSAVALEQAVISILRTPIDVLRRLRRDILQASCQAPSFAKFAISLQLDVAHAASFDIKRLLFESLKKANVLSIERWTRSRFHLILSREEFAQKMALAPTFCEIEGNVLLKDLRETSVDDDGSNLTELERGILSWNYLNAKSFDHISAMKFVKKIQFPKDTIDVDEVEDAVQARLALSKGPSQPAIHSISLKSLPLTDFQEWMRWVERAPGKVIRELLRRHDELFSAISNPIYESQLHALSILTFALLFEHSALETSFSIDVSPVNSGLESLKLCLESPRDWIVDQMSAVASEMSNHRLVTLAQQVLLPCAMWHATPADIRRVDSFRGSHYPRKKDNPAPYSLRRNVHSWLSVSEDKSALASIAIMINNHAWVHFQMLNQVHAEEELTESYFQLNSACHRALNCSGAWEGLIRIVSAVQLQFERDRLQDAGIYLGLLQPQSPVLSSFSFFISTLSVIIGHNELSNDDGLRASSSLRASLLLNLEEETKGGVRKRIAIYCNEYGLSWWPKWGPRSFSALNPNRTGAAAGGSEEAVAYLSMALARRGIDVDIYGDIDPADRGLVFSSLGRMRWLHLADFDRTACLSPFSPTSICYDLFVAWRYSLSLPVAMTGAKKRVLWLHDLVSIGSLPPAALLGSDPAVADALWVQSNFHRNHILNEYNDSSVSEKIIVVPNGYPIEALILDSNKPNDNNIFVFSSAPNRGLQEVLEVWSNIKRFNPAATLHIFYGFTDKALAALQNQFPTHDQYSTWMNYIQNLLRQDGVVYHGAVDHSSLATFFSTAGFLLYPTSFPETGCITMIKAMIAGVIPITSKLQDSVLSTLGERFDLGPDSLTRSIAADYGAKLRWLAEAYVPRIFNVLDMDPHYLLSLREDMKAHMRAKYSWNSSAELIESLLIEE